MTPRRKPQIKMQKVAEPPPPEILGGYASPDKWFQMFSEIVDDPDEWYELIVFPSLRTARESVQKILTEEIEIPPGMWSVQWSKVPGPDDTEWGAVYACYRHSTGVTMAVQFRD